MNYSTNSLQHRLVVHVAFGLLVFSVIAGFLTYQYIHIHQRKLSDAFQDQLVRTVRSQAEISIFVRNEEIGLDILDGLLTSPLVYAVSIRSEGEFRLDKSRDSDVDFSTGSEYPLYSPVDGKEMVGSIIVVKDEKYISESSAKAALRMTLLMLLQLFISAFLIIWFSRKVFGIPIADLAAKVVSIRPGSRNTVEIIPIHTDDEIGLLSGSINTLISAAETALEESAVSRRAAEAANRTKSEFLDNSGEGFLSFGEDMVVESEYSRECEIVFQFRLNGRGLSQAGKQSDRPVCGQDVSDLLFGKEESAEKQSFRKSIKLIFSESIDLKRDLYISLLKKEFKIGEAYIAAHYRLISENRRVMLVLTDVSRERKLEKDVEEERNRLRFVINAVRESREFFGLIDEFSDFKNMDLPDLVSGMNNINIQDTLYEIYRRVHTFKALFAQQGFILLPLFLYEIESRISRLIGKLSGMLTGGNEGFFSDFRRFSQDMINENVLDQDLSVIEEFLGNEFLERRGEIVLSSDMAIKIELMARSLIENIGDEIDKETLQILRLAERIRYVDIRSMLIPHVEGTLMLAERVDRYVKNFRIEGDSVSVHPDVFEPFARALVNVFRNAVIHGIEDPHERIEAGKDEFGDISCRVESDRRRELIVISISDDGRGMDTDFIKGLAVEKGIISGERAEKMSDSEIIDLIFVNNFSTKAVADAISGRGVGLSSVIKELRKLKGTVNIESVPGKGSRFEFILPFKGF